MKAAFKRNRQDFEDQLVNNPMEALKVNPI